MLARLCAFVIWALVAATAVFWGLRLLVRAPAAPAYAVAVGDATAVRGDLSRLLGAAPVNAAQTVLAPEASSRFRLFGIVAPKYADATSAHGVALIAVDGKMPKAYAVGARIDGDLLLQSVSLRTASIGTAPGKAAITLELPPPTAAATGTLPAPGSSGTGFVAPVPQYVPQSSMAPNAAPAFNPAQGLPPPPPIAPPSPPVRPEANAPTQ